MSFSRGDKNRDGFHIVLEILDDSIDFSVLFVKGEGYEELAKVRVTHHILLGNGLSQTEINKISTILSKGFTRLAEETKRKSVRKEEIKIQSATSIIFYPWFSVIEKGDIEIGKPGEINYISKKTIKDTLSRVQIENEVGDAVTIEAFIENIKFNGYQVANPIGKKALNARALAHFYTVPLSLSEGLSREISFHTGVQSKIMTFPKSCALYAYKHSMGLPIVFVSIENEITCLYFIKSGLSHQVVPIYNTLIVDLGLNQIIKNVMDKSGSEKEMALSYIRLLDQDMLSDNASLLIKSACDDALSNWKTKVYAALSKITPSVDPKGERKIVLCSDPKLNGIFVRTLNQDLVAPNNFEAGVSIKQIVFESSLFDI